MVDRRSICAAFAVAALVVLPARAAIAAETPAPQPAATPATHAFTFKTEVKTLFLTQGAAGPGLRPVEGPSFASGAPAAPVSPYDLMSGAPMVPGNVGQNQLTLDAAYRTRRLEIGVTLGVESLLGDRTNQAYWAEPLLPVDNPHLGSPANGFSIVFPTHPGSNDFNGIRAGITQARLSLSGDRFLARGGWFDLKQTLGFIFTPPPATNALSGLMLKTPESLNPNSTSLDAWDAPPATLPMRGFDVTSHAGAITIEATDAALPALPGTPARLTAFSAGHFDDAGHGAMLQTIHVHTGGDPISTTTGFGVPTQIVPSDQGLFAVSTLYGQRETITGARIAEPIGSGLDATLDYAHSTYHADGLDKPQAAGGSWDHVSLAHGLGPATITAHYYRFEPTFATIILPYGVPENIWSVAYSWPGPWLKSNFQLVDSTVLGVNRQGPSLSYSLDTKKLQAFVSISSFRQIAPFTTANFNRLGFIDGFFLVQPVPSSATLGTFRRTAFYLAKAYDFGRVGIDFVDDGLHRDAAAGVPFDAVSYDAPQSMLSWSHQAGVRALVAAGMGYYGMRGSWATGPATNVDYGMHIYYAGVQVAQHGGSAFMVTLRRSSMRGAPYFGALHSLTYGSPDFDATTLLMEERVKF